MNSFENCHVISISIWVSIKMYLNNVYGVHYTVSMSTVRRHPFQGNARWHLVYCVGYISFKNSMFANQELYCFWFASLCFAVISILNSLINLTTNQVFSVSECIRWNGSIWMGCDGDVNVNVKRLICFNLSLAFSSLVKWNQQNMMPFQTSI